jgi:hypothetical protein
VPPLSDQTKHSKPIVGLPTQITNDKGRYRQLRRDRNLPNFSNRIRLQISLISEALREGSVSAPEFDPPKKGPLGITDVNVLLPFIIWIGKRATTSGRLPHTATIRSLVCSREMRPLAFLDPSAFIATNPEVLLPHSIASTPPLGANLLIPNSLRLGATLGEPELESLDREHAFDRLLPMVERKI